MRNTDNFRRQHEELGDVANIIEHSLEVLEPRELRLLLGRFAGKLQVHAAMEDEALYPRLFRDPRPEVRTLAEKMHLEFGTIYATAGAFAARWLEYGAIEERRAVFAVEVKQVFGVLRTRIAQEEGELYPYADRL